MGQNKPVSFPPQPRQYTRLRINFSEVVLFLPRRPPRSLARSLLSCRVAQSMAARVWAPPSPSLEPAIVAPGPRHAAATILDPALTLIQEHFLDHCCSISSRRRRRRLRLHLLRPRQLRRAWSPKHRLGAHPYYLVVCFFLDLLVFSLRFLESNRMDGWNGSWFLGMVATFNWIAF